MNKKLGNQTVKFASPPVIISAASIAGKKEGEGPLKKCFDVVLSDNLKGEKTWEKAESKIVEDTIKIAVYKAGLTIDDIDYIFGGDLLNQDTGSTFGVRKFKRPFFGLFGACSTMGEAMGLAAMAVDGGFAKNVVAGASSHFCASEKQFRFPLDMGNQRPQSSTWTITGDGTVVISYKGTGPRITHVTTGKIVDLGVKDANNMGAAMAPAACDTIITHLKDTKRSANYYDMIATGDLGYVGHTLLKQLLAQEGIYINEEKFTDCGIEIFDKAAQDTHSGGSGCACSAVTFCGYFYPKLKSGELKNILFIPTGALMSTTSSGQGESIPGIAHAIAIESRVK